MSELLPTPYARLAAVLPPAVVERLQRLLVSGALDEDDEVLPAYGLARRLPTGVMVPTGGARLLMQAATAGDMATLREYAARLEAAALTRREYEVLVGIRDDAELVREVRQLVPNGLFDFAAGREIDDATLDNLIDTGLVERLRTDDVILTPIGRVLAREIAKRTPDVQRVKDLIARAREQRLRQVARANSTNDSSDTSAIKQIDELEPDERRLYIAILRVFRELEQILADRIEAGTEAITAQEWSEYVRSAFTTLDDIALANAMIAAETIGVLPDVAQMSALLYDWTMRYTTHMVDTQLWNTTRDLIAQIVAQWRATPNEDRAVLIERLQRVVGASRAETIAITAATEAATAGVTAYRDWLKEEYGLAYVRVWRTAADERVCPICGPLNGKREADWGGRSGPPAHPRCRCGVSLRREQ